jgi:hypothetical protein
MTQSIWRNQKVVAIKLLVVTQIPEGAQRLGYSFQLGARFRNRAGDLLPQAIAIMRSRKTTDTISALRRSIRARRADKGEVVRLAEAIAGLSLLAAIRLPAQSPVTKLCRNGRYEVPIFEGSKRRVRRYPLLIFLCADISRT